MATNVQRSGLSFDKFFRRRSSLPERTKDSEKNANNTDEDADASKEAIESGLSKVDKLFGQKSVEGKNKPSDDLKTASKKEIDEVSSQTTDGSKKSSKKKAASSTKQEEKLEESETRKELIIKDDVGQVKLTEIINNSIKEAVLNIVKEGVCPLADSLERPKDQGKKAPSSVGQEAQDKENKPGSPKHLDSVLSEVNKTFDSHLCRSQYQPSSSSRNPYKSSDHDRGNSNQFTRELCPHVSKDRKVVKSSKQKDKILREVSPKISRLAKGSSHFRTDNRRMTGNVNIYICSEANENAKDKKQKDKNQCNDNSETTSETKTCTSSLSVSTSKLVAALRKKQRKNQEDQPLNCLCDIPESSTKQIGSVSEIGEDGDDVSCLCDEGSGDAEFLDTQSSSSKDCVCGDGKFSDLDFAAESDLGNFDRACTSQYCRPISESASNQYTSYDNNDFWPCASENCSNYEDDYRGKRFKQEQGNAEKDLEECCSCCNLKRCQKDQPRIVPCHQEPRGRNNRTQFNRCPCIVEEEDEDCCIDNKELKETFTVCGNADSKEESFSNQDLKKNSEIAASESGSEILKGKTQSGSPKNDRTMQIASASSQKIIDNKDDPNVTDADAKIAKSESPRTALSSNLKKNRKKLADRESKTVSGETSKVDETKNSGKEQVTETAEASKDYENPSPVADKKQRNPFLYRSIKRAGDMAPTRKDENAVASEENKNSRGCSPECLTNPKVNGENGTSSDTKGACDPFCSGIEKRKSTSGSTSNPRKSSRSRISTAIASRRSSVATTNDGSNLSIPQGQIQPQTSGSPTNLSTNQSIEKPVDLKQGSKDSKSQKLFENSDCCCKNTEPPEDESCKCSVKCRKVINNSSVCCKKMETPKTKLCPSCPTCGNPVDCCICCKRKPEPIVEDLCKCCPRCRRPIAECKCCCVKQEEVEEAFCDCCCRSKRLCCCEENFRVKRSLPKKCRQPSDFKDNHRQCGVCCNSKAECRCNKICPERKDRCPKSMICIYCDNPQEDCTCRAPVRKCSQCGLPLDVCNCKTPACCDCSGRLIVPPEGSNEQTICVTAWKPRRSVRRYFAREADDGNFEEDCPCYDKTKPYGSDGLPYQKRGVFSTVMSELQQKMSGSVCCNVCRKVPCCCCCAKNERGPEEKIERKQRLSTITERRIPCPSQERSRSKSPAEICKCAPNSQRKRGRKVTSKICNRCRTSPCRCRRSSASPQKKPQAKCYYCKNSPCICVPVIEPANTRQFRSADSSHRCKKERSSTEKKINADSEDSGYRGRAVVPCPGSQQIRKYCYQENRTKQYPPNLSERVR